MITAHAIQWHIHGILYILVIQIGSFAIKEIIDEQKMNKIDGDKHKYC